ncbi:MAG TPA: hypothetical protein VFF06_11445 [Polyangia bacterium]|nr:hypothetical protein [Polyangia bacterium]
MAEEQRQQEMSEYEQTRERIEAEREEKEQLAYRLSREADRQMQRAVEGMFALPAAIALRFAASALYTVGFLARGFEVFQRSAEMAREARERRPNGGWRQGGEPSRVAQPPH